MGVIIRTVGEGQKARYFIRDLAYLIEQWRHIEQKVKEKSSSACVFQEPDLVERTVRDFLTEEVDRVLIDNKDDHERTQKLVAQISKRSAGKIAFYKDSIPIFERFNIERQIEQTGQRKVPLPSGGEIIIDETEALIASIRSSPPVRRVSGRTNNITGRYPSPKMGVSIQFESEVTNNLGSQNPS